MAIKLYTRPMSSGTKVHWALEELGVAYDAENLDSKGTKTPDYLAINPNGKVPSLVDGDETYFESAAILIHLGDRYGVERGLWPAARAARAEAMSWLVWAVAELNSFMMQHIYHAFDSPVSYAPAQRSQATADYNGSETRRMLGILDERLAHREHILGDFSLVDVAAASVLFVGRMLGLALQDWPHVVAYVDRCTSRPAAKRMR